VIENFFLHSKELELGQNVLRYNNTDRIMVQSGSKVNWSNNRSENYSYSKVAADTAFALLTYFFL